MNYGYTNGSGNVVDGKTLAMKQWYDDEDQANHDFLFSTRGASHHYERRAADDDIRRKRGGGRASKKRRRVWSERLLDGLRSFVAFLFSNVGISCLVVGYTIAGAFIFVAIEGSHELTVLTGRSNNISIIRNSTAMRLWNLTSQNTFSEKNWRAKVESVLEDYQAKIVRAIKKDDYEGNDHRKRNQKWGFAGAFLYSLTVITTIGYGNTCPKTLWGRIVTIVYAIFGVPLFLLYLNNIGDILAGSFKWTYARCCLCRCRKRRIARRRVYPERNDGNSLRFQHQIVRVQGATGEERNVANATSAEEGEEEEEDDDDDADDDDDDEYNPSNISVPLTLCVAIMVGYVCGGAKLFSEWESWNFLDGSYFCFVSLSTIGFGDIVPGDKIYAGQGLALSSVFCSMYLMLGMALMVMCFKLMQEEVVAKYRSLKRSVKHILSCDR